MNIQEELKNLQEYIKKIEIPIEQNNNLLENEKNREVKLEELNNELEIINKKLIQLTNLVNNEKRMNEQNRNKEYKIYTEEKERICQKKQQISEQYIICHNEIGIKILNNNLEQRTLVLDIEKIKDDMKMYEKLKIENRRKYLSEVKNKNAQIRKNKDVKENLIIIKNLEDKISDENIRNEKNKINKEYYDYIEELKSIEKLIEKTTDITKKAKLVEMKLDLENNDIRKNMQYRLKNFDKSLATTKKQLLSLYNDYERTKYVKKKINNIQLPKDYKNMKKILQEKKNNLETIKKYQKQLENDLFKNEEENTPTYINLLLENEVNNCELRWNKINERVENANKNIELKYIADIKKLEQNKTILLNQINKLKNDNVLSIDKEEVQNNNELLKNIKNRVSYLQKLL